jgi:hypothetical protein
MMMILNEDLKKLNQSSKSKEILQFFRVLLDSQVFNKMEEYLIKLMMMTFMMKQVALLLLRTMKLKKWMKK